MPQFAIVGDHFGVREDVPKIKLSTAFLASESENVTYQDGILKRMPGRGLVFVDINGVDIPVPDANPVIHWHYHADPAGTQYCFAYTKAHVYLWDNGNRQWDLMFTCSSDCTHWSSASFKDKVISTNNVDLIQQWDEDTPGTAFAAMGDPVLGIDLGGGNYLTAAAYVIVYETYLHFLDTVENGAAYHYRDRWSSRNDETDFDETGSGDTGSHDLEAGLRIKGAGIYTAGSTSLLCIFTNHNITAAALVEDAIVFRFDEISGSRGAVGPDTIVNDPEGNLYYLGTDWMIHQVFSEARISDAINATLRGMNRNLAPYVRAGYIENLDQLWWAVPKDSSSTGNDKVVRLNRKTGGWEPSSNMEISSFGRYAVQSDQSIDDIDEVIDEYDHIIDSVENAEGWGFDVVGDYSGHGYKVATESTDVGAAFSGSAVISTDLTNGASLNTYKRTEGVCLWFTAEAAENSEVTIAIRTDEDDGFTNYGTVSLYSTKRSVRAWLPIDVRGVQFDIQLSGSNPFGLEGMIWDYSFDGER